MTLSLDTSNNRPSWPATLTRSTGPC